MFWVTRRVAGSRLQTLVLEIVGLRKDGVDIQRGGKYIHNSLQTSRAVETRTSGWEANMLDLKAEGSYPQQATLGRRNVQELGT